jgi:hypothetical protein
VGFTRVIGTAHRRPLGGAVAVPEVLIEHLDGPTDCRPKSALARKSFLPPELLGWPFAPGLGTVEGQNEGLNPML